MPSTLAPVPENHLTRALPLKYLWPPVAEFVTRTVGTPTTFYQPRPRFGNSVARIDFEEWVPPRRAGLSGRLVVCDEKTTITRLAASEEFAAVYVCR